MGANNGNECGEQYELTVRITAWSGERWANSQTEANGSCDWNVSDKCPTG
jgi:hypothetical protein